MNKRKVESFWSRFDKHGQCLDSDDCRDMELRDWFAGQVLAGHIASCNPAQWQREAMRFLAEQAYDLADAMLKAREVN